MSVNLGLRCLVPYCPWQDLDRGAVLVAAAPDPAAALDQLTATAEWHAGETGHSTIVTATYYRGDDE